MATPTGSAAWRSAPTASAARNPVGWRAFAGDAGAEGAEHAKRSERPAACRAFAAAALWERQEPWHRHELAWAQLAAGELAAFRATCRALHADHRTTADVERTYRLAAELGTGLAPGP